MLGKLPRRLALGLVLLAVACSPSAPQTGTSSGTSSTAPASGPKKGGSLVLAGVNLTFHDPHQMTSPSDVFMAGLEYNQLLRWPKDPDKGFGPEPELVDSWQIAPDALSATFKLHPGVKFAQVAPVNGREFTADDVKWNLDRMRSDKPYFPRRLIWSPIDSVTVSDKYTFVIKLKNAWPDLLTQLAHPLSKMIAKEAVEAAGDDMKFNSDWKFQVGTGPFILKDFQKDVGSKYVKNPEYFKTGQPYVDDITVRWYNDQTARMAAIRAGEVADHGGNLTPTGFQLLKTVQGVVTMERPSQSWTGIMFNLTVKPFDNVKVRQAIAYAVDVDAIIKGPYGGGASVARAAIPPSFKDLVLPQSEWYKLDLTKAKQLLTEAGYPNGFKFTLMTLGNLEESKLAGEVIKEQLAKVNVEVVLDYQDFANFTPRAAQKNFEANFIRTWGGDVVTAGYFDSFYLSNGPRNYMSYKNTEYDNTIAELNKTLDAAKRKDLAYKAQRILMEEVPVANMLTTNDFYAWQSWFKGYGTNWLPGGISSYSDEYWIDK